MELNLVQLVENLSAQIQNVDNAFDTQAQEVIRLSARVAELAKIVEDLVREVAEVREALENPPR